MDIRKAWEAIQEGMINLKQELQSQKYKQQGTELYKNYRLSKHVVEILKRTKLAQEELGSFAEKIGLNGPRSWLRRIADVSRSLIDPSNPEWYEDPLWTAVFAYSKRVEICFLLLVQEYMQVLDVAAKEPARKKLYSQVKALEAHVR